MFRQERGRPRSEIEHRACTDHPPEPRGFSFREADAIAPLQTNRNSFHDANIHPGTRLDGDAGRRAGLPHPQGKYLNVEPAETDDRLDERYQTARPGSGYAYPGAEGILANRAFNVERQVTDYQIHCGVTVGYLADDCDPVRQILCRRYDPASRDGGAVSKAAFLLRGRDT